MQRHPDRPPVRDLALSCDGLPVREVTLANGTLSATVMTRGASLRDLRLTGIPYSLTVGSPDPAAYEGPLNYFGAIVGPVANRIAGGAAALGDARHMFDRNENDTNTLHGGRTGTHGRNWDIEEVTPTRAVFVLNLLNGTGGFPGNRAISATYTLKGATLGLTVTALTDAPTWINFAHHGYWNLDGTPDLTGHTLQIKADRYLPTDAAALVTGAIADVEGTPFDHRMPRPIGPHSAQRLDHNFCVAPFRRRPKEMLTLTGASGVRLHVGSSEPGVQIYDAAGANGAGAVDYQGHPIGPFCGVAIEPQGWPDAPNQRAFPSVAINGGIGIQQITSWRFETPAEPEAGAVDASP